jgi:hypothetical protein
MGNEVINIGEARERRLQADLPSSTRIEAITQAAEAAAIATLKVQDAVNDSTEVVRRAATNALNAIFDLAFPARASSEGYRGWRLLRVGLAVEAPLARFRHRGGIGRRLPLALHEAWTPIGIAMTLGACASITVGDYFLGAALILARVSISVLMGRESVLPFEAPAATNVATSTSYSRSGTRTVVRCVIGHLCDVLPLLALSIVLVSHARPLWGFALVTTGCVMLIATLLRVSSLQVGTPIRRLTLERPFRILPLVLALIAASFWEKVVPPQGVPLLAFAASGSLLYAGIEVCRSLIRLWCGDLSAGPGYRSVVMSVHGSSRTSTYLSEIRQQDVG